MYVGLSPQNITSMSTDTSVLVSSHALDPPPDRYRITITYTNITNTSNLALTITIQILGTATEVEYSQLIPQQQYSFCVIAVDGTQTFESCDSFQTSPIPSPNPSPSPCPGSSQLVGGVLGFVIVVLVLLLVVAGVGLDVSGQE